MDNAEEIFQCLDEFSKRKPKIIPRELEEYLAYVARTGDPVYQWPIIKCLFKEKLLSVITEFYEASPGLEIPPCPNVDPFNYDTLKNSLIEKIESFSSAPFTVQRICELLTAPHKQYSRIDKFMRAIEKNVLVVSTREPGVVRHVEHENGDATEPMVNGSDNSDYNVDVEMEDVSWKEQHENNKSHPQAGSSESTDDDIQAKWPQSNPEPQDELPETREKTEYESITPPEINITDDNMGEVKPDEDTITTDTKMVEDDKTADLNEPKETIVEAEKTDKPQVVPTLLIPEIIIHTADMTEAVIKKAEEKAKEEPPEESKEEVKPLEEESSQEVSVPQEVTQPTAEVSEVENDEAKNILEMLTSSEESSSSSDNTDGNSNSPDIHSETTMDGHEESTHSILENKVNIISEDTNIDTPTLKEEEQKIKEEFYTISDVKSELPKSPAPEVEEIKEIVQEQAAAEEPVKIVEEVETPKEEVISEST